MLTANGHFLAFGNRILFRNVGIGMRAPQHDPVEQSTTSRGECRLVEATREIEGVLEYALRGSSEDAGIEKVEERP